MGRGAWGYAPPPPPGGPMEIDELRERLSRLEQELAEVRRKLDELKGGE